MSRQDGRRSRSGIRLPGRRILPASEHFATERPGRWRYVGMNFKSLGLLAFAGVSLIAMSLWSRAQEKENSRPAEAPKPAEGQEVATFGAGCFWCVEAVFERLDGVVHATSGYMGGHVKNPTYEEVCKKTTGHAEVVQVIFDPKKISYTTLLDWFWKLHDPTQLNAQGNDVGPQYRSAIFFHNEEQKKAATASKLAAAPKFPKPIVTEITAAPEFYPAEVYHQEYYKLNKNANPYCPAVITPKMKKLGLED